MASTVAAVMVRVPGTARWSSGLSFVLAVAGSTVGLGNLCALPHLVARHGGGAFVLVYLGCMLAVGAPVLGAALSLGRRGGADPATAIAAAGAGRGRAWSWAGQFLTLSAFIALSCSSVVAGWTFDYAWLHANGRLATVDPAGAVFGLVTSPARSLATHSAFIVLTAAVLAAGVREGLDRAIRWLMPMLLALIVALVLYAASTSAGFGAALGFMFATDFTRLTTEGVLAALGHALGTMGIVAGGMICYGAYSGGGMPLARTALAGACLAALLALLATLVILSFTFAAGLRPAPGPRLLFVTLPAALAGVSGGGIAGTVVCLVAATAALLAALALLEPVVNAVARRTGVPRSTATAAAAFGAWLAGAVLILSPGMPAGAVTTGLPQHALLDPLVSGWMLPVGALVVLAAAGSVRR